MYYFDFLFREKKGETVGEGWCLLFLKKFHRKSLCPACDALFEEKGHPLNNEETSPEELNPEDKRTEENLRHLFRSLTEASFPPDGKEALRQRILSATEDKPVRRLGWSRVAAVVALLALPLLAYWYFRQDNAREKMQALAHAAKPGSDATQLILNDHRTVLLDKENSDVYYSREGIRIDSGSVLREETEAFNTLVVPYGKRSTLTLADGTRIWVNSGSRLVYPARFGGSTREVYLEGEAYFVVAHDPEHPFWVHTKSLKTKVTGTEFDISSYEDDRESYAVLTKGSIELTPEGHSGRYRLEPGMKALYRESSIQLAKINVEEYVSWREGYLAVRKAPLREIVKKLSRYYKLELVLPEDLDDQDTFSGNLYLQDDPTQVFSTLCTANSLIYHLKGRRVVFEKIDR